jgi:hypothetical protein
MKFGKGRARAHGVWCLCADRQNKAARQRSATLAVKTLGALGKRERAGRLVAHAVTARRLAALFIGFGFGVRRKTVRHSLGSLGVRQTNKQTERRLCLTGTFEGLVRLAATAGAAGGGHLQRRCALKLPAARVRAGKKHCTAGGGKAGVATAAAGCREEHLYASLRGHLHLGAVLGGGSGLQLRHSRGKSTGE